MKPKFEIGDWVEVEFSANIEGILASVRKRLVVTGILFNQSPSPRPKIRYDVEFFYRLNESWPTPDDAEGKEYHKIENLLIPLEPMINEMKKAQAQQP